MLQYCMNCMNPVQPGTDTCPHCGRRYEDVVQLPYAVRSGTKLNGKYLVGRAIGEGGFGITYIGLDVDLNRRVAIKEYFPLRMGLVSRDPGSNMVVWAEREGFVGKEEGYQSFLKEARKMARLDQITGVVDVREFFAENDTAYIVMPYIEGPTLLKKLQDNGPMSFSACLDLLTPVFHALSEVHSQGIIHRDISPDNLKIDAKGTAWLLDLGAAKDLKLQMPAEATSQQVAKHGYSPREQYLSTGDIGTWTDVYAMAATIYHSVTGQLPPSVMDRMAGVGLQCLPPLTQAQFEVLSRGMALDHNQRIQTMDELLKGLQAVRSGSRAGVPAPGPISDNRQPIRKTVPNGQKPAVSGKVNNGRTPGRRPARDKNNLLLMLTIASAAVLVIVIFSVIAMLWKNESASAKMETPVQTTSPLISNKVYTGPGQITTTEPAAFPWETGSTTAPVQPATLPPSNQAETTAPSQPAAWPPVTQSTVPPTTQPATLPPATQPTVPPTTQPVTQPPVTTLPTQATLPPVTQPATTAPAQPTIPAPAPKMVFLNELNPSDIQGKLWTRSMAPVPDGADTNDSPAWDKTSRRGHTSGPVRDISGNTYTYGISVDSIDAKEYTVSYDLNGEYSRFSGYVACPSRDSIVSKSIRDNDTKLFLVWLDGVETEVVSEISPQSGRLFFDISIEGVKVLKIGYPPTQNPNEIATLFDGKLTR